MAQKTILLTCMLCCISGLIWAQEEFTPYGSPFARIFFNYHADLSGNGTAFEIQRAYLGYKYNMTPEFSGHITLDVGSPEVAINDSVTKPTSLEMTAYLKTAAIAYSKGRLGIEAGLISLQQFKIQENFWGHRYIYASFQDWAKLGPSADLGALVSYKLSDFLSVDFTLRNGEGYKKIQSDKALNAGLGWTLSPAKGLVIRGFYDYLDKEIAQYTIASFIGYKNDFLSVGAESDVQINNKNKQGHNIIGYSFYASWNLTKKFQLFGRFDRLGSNTPEGKEQAWNYGKDGYLLIGGMEYSPIKNIRIALDYQGYLHDDDDKQNKNLVYLNFLFSF